MTGQRLLTILASILFVGIQISIGQQLLLSESIEIPNGTDYQLIGRYKEQVLLYRKNGCKMSIQSFGDKDLKEKWIKTIELDNNNTTSIVVIPDMDCFFVLYCYYKKNQTHIRLKKLNTEAEEISDIEIGVFEEPCYLKKDNVVFSEDKSHFLIYLNSIANNKLELIAFDLKEQKTHWQKKIDFEKEKPSSSMEYILINNAGKIYLVFNDNNNKAKRHLHQFNIYHIELDGQKTLYQVPFENYISYDMEVQYDEKNNQLVAAGLYSNENYLANGLFYFRTNLVDSAPQIHLSEFDETFIRSLTGKKNKKITGIQNFKICPLILRNDGGVLLIAEQQFVFQSMGNTQLANETNIHSDYLHENILLASIHPTGEIYWKEVLFKSQHSENYNVRYASFFTFRTNSSIRFLYNNDILWDTSIFEYIVNGQGKTQRNALLHQERRDGILPLFSDALQLSSSELVVLSEQNNKLQLLKINY